MNKTEIENRIRRELGYPFYKADISESNYSEEDYQKIKKDLEEFSAHYADDYEDHPIYE